MVGVNTHATRIAIALQSFAMQDGKKKEKKGASYGAERWGIHPAPAHIVRSYPQDFPLQGHHRVVIFVQAAVERVSAAESGKRVREGMGRA